MFLKKLFSIRFIIICFLAALIAYGSNYYLKSDLVDVNQKAESETEIALIFFGCSTCPAAGMKEIPSTLNTISNKIQAVAYRKGYNFSLIGISKESNIKKGLNYLTKIAPFHEISLGKNMQNIAIQKYVWETYDNPLSGSTPQILITKRTYETYIVEKDTTILPIIGSEKILVRKVGLEQFIQLSNQADLYNSL